MNGDYVKLVEEEIKLTEELSFIMDSIQKVVKGALAQVESKPAEFTSKLKDGYKNKKDQELTDHFMMVNGKLRANSPNILKAADATEADFTVNYERPQDIEAVIKKLKSAIYNDLILEIGDLLADQNVPEKAVEKLTDAFLRETVVALLSKVTLESEAIGEEELRNIVANALRIEALPV